MVWNLLLIVAILAFGLFGAALAADAGFDWRATDDQKAYDAGYEHFEAAEKFGNSLSCASLTKGHEAALKAQNDGVEPEVVALMLRTQYDSIMKKVGGIDERNGYSGLFISGYWDAANENCPQAFFESTFVGRPDR